MMTEVYKVIDNKIDTADMRNAVEAIRNGGLVAFPTETVYGLGGDATNPLASKKIYAAKGRPSDNPLIVHIAYFSQLEDIVSEVPEAARALADNMTRFHLSQQGDWIQLQSVCRIIPWLCSFCRIVCV